MRSYFFLVPGLKLKWMRYIHAVASDCRLGREADTRLHKHSELGWKCPVSSTEMTNIQISVTPPTTCHHLLERLSAPLSACPLADFFFFLVFFFFFRPTPFIPEQVFLTALTINDKWEWLYKSRELRGLDELDIFFRPPKIFWENYSCGISLFDFDDSDQFKSALVIAMGRVLIWRKGKKKDKSPATAFLDEDGFAFTTDSAGS